MRFATDRAGRLRAEGISSEFDDYYYFLSRLKRKSGSHAVPLLV